MITIIVITSTFTASQIEIKGHQSDQQLMWKSVTTPSSSYFLYNLPNNSICLGILESPTFFPSVTNETVQNVQLLELQTCFLLGLLERNAPAGWFSTLNHGCSTQTFYTDPGQPALALAKTSSIICFA